MSLGKGIGAFFTGTVGIIMSILGVCIYIWSIVIAYAVGGIISAAITIALPGISQLYWFFRIWYWTGSINNTYCLAIIGYVVALIIIFIGVTISEKNSPSLIFGRSAIPRQTEKLRKTLAQHI
jgi:hypothetical protein